MPRHFEGAPHHGVSLSGALLAMLVSSASADPPDALAPQQADLDGDGHDDVIAVSAEPPRLRVQLSTGGSFVAPVTGAIDSARIEIAAASSTRPAIAVARIERRDQPAEAIVLTLRDERVEELWRGEVGALGDDGEGAMEVAITDAGLLRYQTRPGVERCDGQPARLFTEGWDFSSGRFRAIYNPTGLPADAEELQASSQPPMPQSPELSAVFRATAASTQRGAGDARELTAPIELDDGNPATAWRESVGGNGRGEFLTFRARADRARVAALRIVPGDAASSAAWKAANRLRRIGIVLGPQQAYWVRFSDSAAKPGAAFWVTLPEPVATRCVTVVLDATYRGTATPRGSGETAISELTVLTELDLAPGGADAALAAEVARGGSEGRQAARILASRSGGAAALAAALASASTPAAQLRLRLALAASQAPDARELAAGLAMAEATGADRAALTAALVRLGAAALPGLAALLTDAEAPLAARTAAADALATLGAAARPALLTAAGAGPRGLRVAVSKALAAPEDAQPALLAAATDSAAPAAEADLWRAIELAGRAHGFDSSVVASAAARLEGATAYELRYRLLALVATAGDGAALQAAWRVLSSLPEDAGGEALRRVAAEALADNPAPAARALLVRLADNADPGVRLAVAAALGQRADADANSDALLVNRLRSDGWPAVRRRAAAALTPRCQRSAPVAEALEAALRDRALPVRREALLALVACRAPRIEQTLERVALDAAAAMALREVAVLAIPRLGERATLEPLLKVFAAARQAAWSDPRAPRLAAAALTAMGQLGGRSASRTILAAARDASFPEIQAAAVTAAGTLCPEGALPVLTGLSSSSEPSVAVAARAALRRCKR